MAQFKQKTIHSETLDLSSKTPAVLGPDLIVKKCDINLRTNAKALTISKVRFTESHISAKSPLIDFRFLDSHISGCKFSGTFRGCDFGNSPTNWWSEGGIESTDFSSAELDACRFLSCDIRTIIFPGWPCFVIENPVQQLSKLRSLKWPGELSFWIDGFSYYPPSTDAAVYLGPKLIESFGGTEKELRKSLKACGINVD